MTKLNKDGLIVGEHVDFATIVRVDNERKKAEAEKLKGKRNAKQKADGNKDASVEVVHGSVSEEAEQKT